MFIPGKPFQPSALFVGKARAFPSEAPFGCCTPVKAPVQMLEISDLAMMKVENINIAVTSITTLFGMGSTKEYQRGKYPCTVNLLFDWFGISCLTTDNFSFYLKNGLIQTGKAGGQPYSDTVVFLGSASALLPALCP